jgi:hypothetical protein
MLRDLPASVSDVMALLLLLHKVTPLCPNNWYHVDLCFPAILTHIVAPNWKR